MRVENEPGYYQWNGYGLDDRSSITNMILLVAMFKLVLWYTLPSIWFVPEDPAMNAKRPKQESHGLPQSSADVTNAFNPANRRFDPSKLSQYSNDRRSPVNRRLPMRAHVGNVYKRSHVSQPFCRCVILQLLKKISEIMGPKWKAKQMLKLSSLTGE
jgi:hypothetical protein